MLLSCLSFTACNQGDEENTNQYTGGIKLNVFGPSPVARGGELRFLGSGMDKVTAVVIPGSGELTDIKVISSTEIRITVPQTAEPGLLVLKTPKGDITTLTKLTFMEPVSIESVSPLSFKAGATLTIKGEYLNLVKEVIFPENVVVLQKDFISQTRNEIQLIVPAEAASGKLIISDGAEIPNWIYSDEALEVTLPTITGIAPNPLKAGGELTIMGTDFDLVAKVVLPGGKEIEVESATEKIVVATDKAIQEGKVTLVAKSGVKIESEALQLVKPEITALSATTVKNNGTLTITGKNLDLVSEIEFQNATVSEFTVQSETSIGLVLPATATDGAFVLKTKSATSVTGESLTFKKPVVTAFSAESIKAKQNLTLTGTDLDLVSKVNFGAQEGNIVEQTETKLTVTVPVGAANGALTLTTVNGTEVSTTQEIKIDVTLPVITSISAEGPGGKITVEGTELSLIKTIYLQDKTGAHTIKVSDYGMKSDTKVEFYHVEGALTGDITPMMVTVDGDEGLMPTVYCGGTDPILPTTIMITNFNGGGNSQNTWGKAVTFGIPENSLDGTACMIGKNAVSDWNWAWSANWGGLPALDDTSKYVLKMDIRITTPAPGVSVGMTIRGWDNEVSLGNIFDNSTNGRWITLSFPISGVVDGTGDWGIFLNCPAGTHDLSGIYIDNLRFDLK